jgi:uncharacterized protein YbjT (DUF2867 family)
MKTRLFITGATGNTGRAFLDDLFRSHPAGDIDARCLVLPGDPLGDLSAWPVEAAEGDARDARSTAGAWDGDRTIVNISSIHHSKSILEGCSGARGIVAVSSTGLFSRYRREASRIEESERAVKTAGIPWTILRPTMIYGTPLDRNISKLIRYVTTHGSIMLPGGGKALFQPVTAQDLASCITASLFSQAAAGKSYEISGVSVLSLKEIVEMIAHHAGRDIRPIPVPLRMVVMGLRIMEMAGRTPPVRADQVKRLLEDKVFDHSAAASDLGFSPVTFEEGLRREMELMRR